MKKTNVKKLILIAAAVISLVIVLMSFGKLYFAPWKTVCSWDYPSSWSANENSGAVIDSQRKQLTFLDSQNRVVRRIKLSGNSKIDKASNLYVYGDTVYVAGAVLNADERTVKTDRVVTFDLKGRFKDVIYEADLSSDSPVTWSHIFDVKADESGVYFAVMHDKENGSYKIELIRLTDGPETLFETESELGAFTIDYNIKRNTLSFVDLGGAMTSYDLNERSCLSGISVPGSLVSCFCVTDSGRELYSDVREGNVYLDDEVALVNVGVAKISVEGENVFFCDAIHSSIAKFNIDNRTFVTMDSAAYSAGCYIINLIRILAALFLIALAAAFMFRSIAKTVREKNYEAMKRAAVLTLFALSLVGLAVFYSYNIFSVQMKDIAMTIDAISEGTTKTSGRGYGEILDEIDFKKELSYDELKERTESFSELDSFFNSFITSTKNDVSDFFCYYYKCDDGEYVMVYDSDREDQIGAPAQIDFLSAADEYPTVESLSAVKYADENSRYLSSFKNTYDENGEINGVLEYGIDYTPYRKTLIKNCLEMAMTLMVIACALYLLISEIRSLNEMLAKKKAMLSAGRAVNESLYVRQYSFIIYFISTIDAVVAALIVVDLCRQSGFDTAKSALYISSLPTIMYLGSCIGSFIYTALISKIKVRTFSSVFYALAALMLLLEGIGIKLSNIYIYFAARLLFYVAQDNIYVLVSSISARAEDESEKLECHKSAMWASVSAGIISGVIAGYASQYISNESVYFLAAIIAVAGVAVSILILPKGKYYGRRSKKAEGDEKTAGSAPTSGTVIKYITNPRIIAYILFLTIPLSIFKQYKSVLFPLVSSDYALPKVYITNLYIFARTMNVVVGNRASKLLGESNLRTDAIKALVLCSLMFGGFVINASIVWAVIMIFVTDLYVKSANPIHKMLHLNFVREMNMDIDKANGLSEIISPLLSCIQTPLIACFLKFSSVYACLAVGSFGLICAGLFSLITFLADKNKQNSRFV